MSPPCHKLNKICQLKVDERKKETWLSEINGKREWSRPQAQRLKMYHHHSFLLETGLSCALHVGFLLFCYRGLSSGSLCPQTAPGFCHAGLGTLEGRESSSLHINSWEGYQLMQLGSHAPTPWLKGGWVLWLGRPGPCAQLWNNQKCMFDLWSQSWHRLPKTLVISWMIRVSCYNIWT